MGLLSNQTEEPIIHDPNDMFLEYSLGYNARSNRYKIAEFSRSVQVWGEGTRILVYTY
jgi:hypothetical protein